MKPGYRKTELGVFPEDWAVVELKALIDETRGIRYGIVQPGAYEPDGRLMVRGQDYSKGWVDESCMFRVSAQIEERYRNARLREGDLIITIVGAGTGHVEVIPKWLDGANLTQTTARIAIDEDKANGQFCKHMLQSEIGQTQVANFLKGGAQPGLNCADVEKFFIPLPTEVQEQRAIAAALSDVDALIASLDTLIAKKRDIKQGAMQQLLTGKTHLPGFSGEWRKTTMADLGFTFGGLTGKSKTDFQDGNARYIPFLNVMTNPIIDVTDLEWVRVSPRETQNKAQHGDLFFNTSSETPEEVGMCSVLLREVPDLYLNSFCFGFRSFDTTEVCGLYLAYYFRSGCGRRLMFPLAQGATRYNLSKSNFLRLELPLPKLSEQEAIAAVLSDMDAEIATLERRCDKTLALKQGMMQELLTGRIRLM